MKKHLSVLMILALSLMGCGSAAPPQAEAAEAEYLDVRVVPQFSQAEHMTCRYPAVQAEGELSEGLEQGLSACNQSIKEKTAEALSLYSAHMEGSMQKLKQKYPEGEIPKGRLDVTADAERADEKVVSIWVNSRADLSDALHVEYDGYGMTLDAAKGEPLPLSHFIKDREKLFAYAEKELEENAGHYELFENYRDFLKESFEKEEPNWFLDTEGLKLVFLPYEIAPFSSGFIEITVPYDSELMTKGYETDVKLPVQHAADMARFYADLNGNEKNETISVYTLENEAEKDPAFGETLHLFIGWDNGEKTVLEQELSGECEDLLLMQTEQGKKYLYAVSAGMSDFRQMTVFDLNGEKPVVLDTLRATPQGHAVFDGADFTLYTKTDVFGTFMGAKNYHIGADGIPVTEDEAYTLRSFENWDTVITTKRSVPVWILSKREAPATERIPKGTELKLTRTDGESYAEAELPDGRLCEIRFETDGESFAKTIDGKSEYDCFEELHYAG